MQFYVSCGMYSSGSTWVFNVMKQLLEEDGPVSAFYGEVVDENFERQRSDRCLIKCHGPHVSMRVLASAVKAPIMLTVRDPRDAVTSFMQRFGRSFDETLQMVSLGGLMICELADRCDPLIFEYSDHFTDRIGTVEAIASRMRLQTNAAQRRRVFESLTSVAVKNYIGRLVSERALDAADPVGSVDAPTQWHPGHVGDGKVGKFKDFLSPEQIRETARVTAKYCRQFGYPLDV